MVKVSRSIDNFLLRISKLQITTVRHRHHNIAGGVGRRREVYETCPDYAERVRSAKTTSDVTIAPGRATVATATEAVSRGETVNP